MNFKFIMVAVILVVALSLVYQQVEKQVAIASIGANAIAKTVCSCVYIAERSLEACRQDDPPGFELVRAWQSTAEDGRPALSSSVMWVVRGEAIFDTNYGCLLQ